MTLFFTFWSSPREFKVNLICGFCGVIFLFIVFEYCYERMPPKLHRKSQGYSDGLILLIMSAINETLVILLLVVFLAR